MAGAVETTARACAARRRCSPTISPGRRRPSSTPTGASVRPAPRDRPTRTAIRPDTAGSPSHRASASRRHLLTGVDERTRNMVSFAVAALELFERRCSNPTTADRAVSTRATIVPRCVDARSSRNPVCRHGGERGVLRRRAGPARGDAHDGLRRRHRLRHRRRSPDFWIGVFDSGDGFRESHIAFEAPDRADGARLLRRRRRAPAPRCCTSRACGPSTTSTTTGRSSATPTATTSKPSATYPSDGR